MATPDIRGDYSLAMALNQPYLMERMGMALRLADACLGVFPDMPPPIITLRIEDWPPHMLTVPQDYPYRIVCVYEPEFARFLACCELGDFNPAKNAERVMAEKTPQELRDRYWALTEELHQASEQGDQTAVAALSDERDVLAKIIAGRGEKIGHSA